MIEFENVKIYTDNIEPSALEQCHKIVNSKIFGNNPIRIMPDVHAGKGCVIGFTAQLADKVVPNIVGVDIGCGMFVVPFYDEAVDFAAIDTAIRRFVPSGNSVHSEAPAAHVAEEIINQLRCKDQLTNIVRLCGSMGTLGGGNHFIEIDKGSNNTHYLIIHSGSRNLGKQVADIYQNKAINQNTQDTESIIAAKIEQMKANGEHQQLEETIKAMRADFAAASDKSLAFLTGQDMEDYLHDMRLCQLYAQHNRKNIAASVLTFGGIRNFKWSESFEVVHNYIDDNRIVRKGAVAAYANQSVLIPLNMRDGCILGKGKENIDWNCSAPHGAGRIMSRAKAKETISLDEYTSSMEGIYTSCVGAATLDEAPQAYKPAQEILDLIQDTVDVQDILKPVYNFKAS